MAAVVTHRSHETENDPCEQFTILKGRWCIWSRRTVPETLSHLLFIVYHYAYGENNPHSSKCNPHKLENDIEKIFNQCPILEDHDAWDLFNGLFQKTKPS